MKLLVFACIACNAIAQAIGDAKVSAEAPVKAPMIVPAWREGKLELRVHHNAREYELLYDGASWSTFNVDTCKSDLYADEITRLMMSFKGDENHADAGNEVLMVGLGGGVIGSKLRDVYSMTVLEKNSQVIEKAPSFWKYMEPCGFDGSHMTVIQGDIMDIKHVGSGTIFEDPEFKFDWIIMDIPDIYQQKDISILHHLHKITTGLHSSLILNTWVNMDHIVNKLDNWVLRTRSNLLSEANTPMGHIYVLDWVRASSKENGEEL